MKGIIFAGCSFTFGHGLEYYSDDNKYIDKPEILITSINNVKLYKTREKIRFGRLVANHFNTYEIIKKVSSGNDQESIKFVNMLFKLSPRNPHMYEEYCEFNDVEYIIFQTSYPERCFFDFSPYGNKLGKVRMTDLNDDEFYDLLKKSNILTIEKFKKLLNEQLFNELKDCFNFYESKNIKCLFWNITEDFKELIENDEFMKIRHIELEYGNKKYGQWKKIIDENKPINNEIKYDYNYFGEVTPEDFHPSKSAQIFIANSIINKIKHREENEKDYQMVKRLL
jgi:hypothetical protein